jgi:multidrug efflux pump subunit AcrA (membrane-fusion protein)
MSAPSPQTPAAPKLSAGRRLWWLFEVLNVRLRFVFLMVLVGFVVGYWENITNYYDRWRRPATTPDLVVAEEVEFYCPMHPNIIRATEGSCPICGMPLSKRPKSGHAELPEGTLAQVQLTPQKVQMGRIGTSPVDYRLLAREIRTLGVVDYDETRRAFISARINGRIDQLMVNYVGQRVEKGDPLVSIYSPDLLVAQEELLSAVRRAERPARPGEARPTTDTLVEAARKKLTLWGITPEQVDQIIARGTTETHLTIGSPISGIVTEKSVLEGNYVTEGAPLYTIADLSVVWLQAKIFEDQIAGAQVGTAVEVRSTAYPAELFAGRIAFIAFAVDPVTRTLAARVEVDNPDYQLRPGMYAHAILRVPVGRITETDPNSVAAASAPGHAPFDTTALTRAYLDLTTAMVDDEVAPAALKNLVAAAKVLAETAPTSIATPAALIAKEAAGLSEKDLAAQRGGLKSLSERVIALVRSQPPAELTLYVVHCPMVEADWLQSGQAIANPYMGSSMPRCGTLTGTVTAKAIQDYGPYVTGYYCPIAPERLFDKPELCPVDKFPFKFVKAEKTLAVPATAVINTGTRTVVYRETEPGTFDMLAVQLGARAGEYFPVLSGLNPGDRVATAGAFLVDAENRLNPAAGAAYFGATGGPQADTGGHTH